MAETMKQNHRFFKDVDRLLRIIYREVGWTFFRSASEDMNSFLPEGLYDLQNESFRNRVISAYLSIYPANYRQEDLEILLDDISTQMAHKFSSTNALDIIFYVSDMIFSKSKSKIYVDFNDILEWDGLRNKLDLKVFITAFLVQQNKQKDEMNFRNIVGHNNKRLHDILDRYGISDNHMHLKASGYTDDINWFSFINKPFATLETLEEFVDSPETFRELENTRESKNEYINFLVKLKYIRIFLYSKLMDQETKENEDLGETRALREANVWRVLKSSDPLMTLYSLNELASIIEADQRMREKYEQIYQDDVKKYQKVEFDFYDSIMRRCLKNPKSEFFRLLVNLYISGASIFKFQLVQDNLGMGFSKFKDKEEMKSFFIEGHDVEEAHVKESVFHKYYDEKYIRSMELRIAPKESVSDYVQLIKELDEMNQRVYERKSKENHPEDLKKIKFGLIIHFIKGDYDLTKLSTIQSFEKRKALAHSADILSEAIERINFLSRIPESEIQSQIVGIDTANYEKNNRPEIFGPIYRKIRSRTEDTYKVNFTYHVGEEFATLSNGLRAIYEVIHLLDYRANDRLGHALALGVNVRDYFEKKRFNIFTTLGDYLDDVVWMYSVLINEPESDVLLPFLRMEYEKFKHELFTPCFNDCKSISLEDYLASYHLRGDDPDVHLDLYQSDYSQFIFSGKEGYQQAQRLYPYAFNYKNKNHYQAFLNQDARILFLEYTFNQKYQDTINQSKIIEANELYIQCVEKVQKILQKDVADKSIFIEANPTSNKKISYVQKYSEIPAINMCGPFFEKNIEHNLQVSLNTDDSAVFMTNLVNEYSMLTASLLREGYDEVAVYTLIEQLAINSNIHSFVKSNDI